MRKNSPKGQKPQSEILARPSKREKVKKKSIITIKPPLNLSLTNAINTKLRFKRPVNNVCVKIIFTTDDFGCTDFTDLYKSIV